MLIYVAFKIGNVPEKIQNESYQARHGVRFDDFFHITKYF